VRNVSAGVLLAALMAAGAAVVGPPAVANAAVTKPAVSAAQRAAAIVRPAVVYLDVAWEGWIRDTTNGKLWDDKSVTMTVQCSGFAVSNDGYIVTAGHCVDPGVEGAGPSFFAEIAHRYVQAGLASAGQEPDLVRTMMGTSAVQGAGVGEPATMTVTVHRGAAMPTDALPARVVSFHPASEGDLALLKVDKTNQPMVALAGTSDIPPGTDVVAIGYPAATDGGRQQSNMDGKVIGPRTGAFYDLSADTTQGMAGGPVTNLNGEIVGLVSAGPRLAGSALIATELAHNGVHSQLGKIDKDYREALDAFYGGHYSEAIAKFDSVLATVPSHAAAQDYRQQAVSLRESEGEPANTTMRYLIIGAAVALILAAAVGVVTLVVARRRRRPPQSPLTGAYPMAPVAYPPISVPPTPYSPAPATVRLAAPTMTYCTNCGVGSAPGTEACATCGNRLP
jgi:serine protease Do